MANKNELLNKLIDYLKDNYDCENQSLDEFGFGMITLTNSKGTELFIAIDENVLGDCYYEWVLNRNKGWYKPTHSNFGHLVNTVIKMFMENRLG